MKTLIKWVGGLVLAVVAMGVFFTFRTPTHLYRFTGEFAGCPARPSCVSSVAADAHAIAPLDYQGAPDAALERLIQIVADQPGARIEHRDGRYLHAVFLTPRMRYHDDVELLVQPDGKIQVRSISRFGYGDHGVNRARVETLRAAFADTAG